MWLILIIVGLFGFLLLFYHISTNGPVLSGPAQVLSKRVELGRTGSSGWGVKSSSWNYLVTFTLADGEEIELFTGEEAYKALTEGCSGFLEWQKDNFVSFETE